MKTVLKSLFSIPVLSLTAAGLMVVVVACSGSSNSNGGDTGDKKTDSGDDDDDDGGTKSDSGDDEEEDAGKDANGNPGAACSGETTTEACLSCCDQKSSGGRAVINNAFKDCNCKDGSECKADCGDNYCSGKPASDDCAQCLKTSEDCEDTAKKACANDTKCTAYSACANDSECDDKDP